MHVHGDLTSNRRRARHLPSSCFLAPTISMRFNLEFSNDFFSFFAEHFLQIETKLHRGFRSIANFNLSPSAAFPPYHART